MQCGADSHVDASAAVVDMADVSFHWPGRQSFALNIGRFGLSGGDRVLMIGPSGGGKSTFLSLLCGINTPRVGRIEVLGTDLARQTAPARDRFRAEHIGVIFQMFNLLPYGSVLDNVMLPLSFAPGRRERVMRSQLMEQEARRLLVALGLDDDVLSKAALALSVGQQQRVAVARALIGSPELIVADEPTSALDKAHQDRFLDLLFEQVTAAGTTLLMVSHDEAMAGRFDRTCKLSDLLTQGQPA